MNWLLWDIGWSLLFACVWFMTIVSHPDAKIRVKEMPVVSKRQNRFFHAHAADKGKLGKVAREFIAATPKGGVKKLPEAIKHGKPRSERWYGKD